MNLRGLSSEYTPKKTKSKVRLPKNLLSGRILPIDKQTFVCYNKEKQMFGRAMRCTVRLEEKRGEQGA